MDTRSEKSLSPFISTAEDTKQNLDELTSQAIYYLARKHSLYNEVTDALTKDRQSTSTSSMTKSMFTGYTSKPYYYFILAGMYHLLRRRIRIIELCFHATAYLFINQYDMNTLIKERENTKNYWEDYQAACKNYDRALKLINFSLWKYVSDFIESNVKVSDFEEILKSRPL